jgi:hypothetical protein
MGVFSNLTIWLAEAAAGRTGLDSTSWSSKSISQLLAPQIDLAFDWRVIDRFCTLYSAAV